MTAVAERVTLTITEPGVYEIPEGAYHLDPVPGGSLSSTGARKLLPPSCPAKFKYEQDHPVYKDVYDFGTVAHKFVLGSGPEVAVLDFEDWRTKESRERRDEARAAGIVPVLVADWARAQEMTAAVRAHPVAGKLLDPARGGFAEQSLFWQDPEFGIWCRARLDWMREAGPGRRFAIADYKTAESADPDAFARSAANYGYDQQDAFYGDGARILGLDDNPMFVFVVQDKNPPYLVSICELDEEDRYAGRRRNQFAAEIFRDCTEAGNWPGYGEGINHVRLPAWSRARHLRGDY